jgi:choline kinase
VRAIILAAGEGSRLRPLTDDRPKCLVLYKGKPILDYQLEVMHECGLEDIVIIKGYKAEALQRPGMTYVLNPEFADTNMVYTLFCAESYFDSDLLISYGDIIYEKSILTAVLESPAEFAVAVSLNWRELWQKRMADPLSDAESMKIDQQGLITELGKKCTSYSEIQGQYMGLFKIRKSMVGEMRSVYHQLDKGAIYDGKPFQKMFMTSFIQALIDRRFPVTAVGVTGDWLEIDTVEDLKVVSSFGR